MCKVMKECVSLQSVADREVFLPNDEIWLYDLQSVCVYVRACVCVCVCVCVCQKCRDMKVECNLKCGNIFLSTNRII